VVGAIKGYPGAYEKGLEIRGLDRAMQVPGVRVFGAAIVAEDGKLYSDGGRLFSVVGEGKDTDAAAERAYEAASYVSVEGDNLHYRSDIARRDRERLQAAARAT
jgi:phosphoribosylamine--glycine ligase